MQQRRQRHERRVRSRSARTTTMTLQGRGGLTRGLMPPRRVPSWMMQVVVRVRGELRARSKCQCRTPVAAVAVVAAVAAVARVVAAVARAVAALARVVARVVEAVVAAVPAIMMTSEVLMQQRTLRGP